MNITANLTVRKNIDITNGSLFQPVYPSDDGLVLYMPFSEPDGSTQLDRSPYGIDGTVSSGVNCNITNGKYGGGCHFNAVDTNSRIRLLGEGATFSSDIFTAEAWIRQDAQFIGSFGYIIDNQDSPNDGWGIAIESGNRVFCNYNLPSVIGTTVLSISGDTWYHVACVSDGVNLTVYVNGIQEGVGAVSGSISETADATIGRRTTAGANSVINGSLDEVRVYVRALTAEEIRTHYLRGQGFGASGAITADKFRVVNTSGNINFIVDESGNVGIGTTSPQNKLNVVGSFNVSNSTGFLGLYQGSDAKVGIGTATPDRNLDVEGTGAVLIKTQNGVASTLYGVNSVNFGIVGTLSNHDFRIFTNNIVKFVVEAGGNVGIGDTTPDAELDIVGASSTATDPILIVDSSSSSSVIFLTTSEIHRGTVRADATGNIVLNAQGGNPYIRLNDGVPASGAGTQYFCSDASGKVTVSASCGSSVLIKKNITNLVIDTMSIINQLVPRKYQWIGNNEISIGFIAQEMESILPEAIVYDQGGNVSGFNYDVVTALNVKAIQELKAENDLLKSELCKKDVTYGWC